jgi:hypothetical protein
MADDRAHKSSAHHGARLRDRLKAGAQDVGDLNLFDFLSGFALIVLSGLLPIVGGIPMQELLIAALLVIAFFRHPVHELRVTRVVIPVFGAGFIYIAVVSATAVPTTDAADWRLRLIRIIATVAYAICLATGRISLKATVYGFAVALLINVPANYMLGVAFAGEYDNALTGFISDKNVAGLAYCVLGLLFFAYQKSHTLRVIAVIATKGCLWLTASRTSMAAFAFAIFWVLVSPKLPSIIKWALAAAMFWVIEFIEENYAQAGVFENRVGSDLLRGRIDAASQIKVDEAPWYGTGLGEAYVYLDERIWFFHNSFWSAQVEGGYVWLALAVLVTLVVMGRPFKSLMSHELLASQALAVALLLCASRLGEVFFTLWWGLALAYAMHAEATDPELVALRDEQGPDLKPLRATRRR